MVAFSVFGFPIYWYWIFYFISFILGYIFLYFSFRSSYLLKYPLLQKKFIASLDDLIVVVMLWVLIGWRLWHVFIYDLSYFLHSPLHILAIWEWGMSFIGGMIGVFLFLLVYMYKKKYKKKDLIILLDIILVITPLWIFFWRLWNYLNQELYWIVVPNNYWWLSESFVSLFTRLRIFDTYSSIDALLRVNTNFLSMFFEWLVLFSVMIFWFLFLQKRKILKPWFLVWLFLSIYSLFRFILEYFRQDSQYEFIGIFSKSQWFFIIFFVIWISFLVFSKRENSI